ncbi:thioredoxin domain-containing protein [Rothia sp. LK2588]|uniref:DsbA family protein n=1 Tax=Rothia sp. LK2588 TaxID=3114369 RepID=UPI0034CDB40E
MNNQLTRRSALTVTAAAAAFVLAACSENKNPDAGGSSSSASSTASASSASSASASAPANEVPAAQLETKLRDQDGYHLNKKLEGAPTVTLYTDFQCPYCKKGEPAYERAARELEGTMNVTVKHFPLPSHQYAVPAACAVQAAEAQGKHMAMSQLVFARQDEWKNASDDKAVFAEHFAQYAQQLGLDEAKFRKDYYSDQNFETIKKDFETGQKLGVNGTPSFVVNGKVLAHVESSTPTETMVEEFKKAAGL